MSTSTRIDVRAGDGPHAPPAVTLSHGPLQARRLRAPAGVVRVALVAGQALLLAGDEVRVVVSVSGPVLLEVVEPAGTVAYDMRGGRARWDAAVTVADGARLTWHAEPFVVAAGADVERRTSYDVEPGCVAAFRETLVLGRTGETGGRVTTRTRITSGGVPVVAEDLDLAPERRTGWAVLGGHRCLDQVTTVGCRLPGTPTADETADETAGGSRGPLVLQAEAVASVGRWTGDELHRSDQGALWSTATAMVSGWGA